MSVGIAIVTCNRPAYCERTVRAVERHLSDVITDVVLVNDGSDAKHAGAYKRVHKVVERMGGMVIEQANGGVAKAKNVGLSYLLANDDINQLFTLEDDIIVQSARAVTGYVAAAEASTISHLSFAHHGEANLNIPDDPDSLVSYFPHAIGAWCMYSRACLEDVGLFDTNFLCAWEHVEHSLRLAMAGYTSGPYKWADATGSAKWLAEIPGSIERSSIRVRDDWWQNIRGGLQYWKSSRRESYDLMFGPGTPLEQWAANIIG